MNKFDIYVIQIGLKDMGGGVGGLGGVGGVELGWRIGVVGLSWGIGFSWNM